MAEAAPIALVLGGTGNIGVSICERFSDGGFEVIATSSKDFDLREAASIEAWFAKSPPSVSVLVHAAGFNVPAPFEELTDEEIHRSFDANVSGFLTVVRAVRPGLVANRGRIVVLSSIFGFLARVGRLPYAMSKHALVGIVKSLALEFADDGILVNAVSPGYIESKLTRQNNDPGTIERLAAAIPLRSLGRTADVAEAVFFLASQQNGYITGHDLVVDGGFSIDGGRG
jgi:NAD(P)-dependent dehydrogenase (short-subunit alcohol dehydrogenase family)